MPNALDRARRSTAEIDQAVSMLKMSISLQILAREDVSEAEAHLDILIGKLGQVHKLLDVLEKESWIITGNNATWPRHRSARRQSTEEIEGRLSWIKNEC